MMNPLPPILDHEAFADIDRHFARMIGGFGGTELPVIAAALLSRNVRLGHICLDLAGAPAEAEELGEGFNWPAVKTWRSSFKKNRAIGGADDAKPLVLDDAGRLYLRRYWEYEQSLARAILERCTGAGPVNSATPEDLQKAAVATALNRRFTVISGGPGTGKTTTVLKILEAIIGQPDGGRLRIALAAPTGKAAARLDESLRNGGSEKLREVLRKPASTLHRLLGPRRGSAFFRHNAKNPLPIDVLVVDEASMAPLTMMAKFFDALPAHTRVILLGDPHQLASVEPGYVLGDIAEAADDPGSPLNGSMVALRKNYRFGEASGIFAFSNAVREGETGRVFEILHATGTPDLSAAGTPAVSHLVEALRPRILAGYGDYLKESNPAEALRKFQQFRVLCALRSGPHGVENLNAKIEEILTADGLVAGGRYYAGLPVLIGRNDYELGLFNGDTGILLPDENGALLAWFADHAGSLRHIAPARLPDWEPAFAMTVHKGQGSEYENVLLVLPERESPVVTRELVYTGLTRARSRVEIWFKEAVLRSAIGRQVKRSSGLGDRLRKS